MKHILLLEPNRDHVPHLIFLLKLADIQCTVARCVEEAVNWLSAAKMMVAHFDLVLWNSFPGIGPEKDLLTEIADSTTIPVVYLQREGSYLPHIPSDGIIICHPDNLLSCLRECLAIENKRSKKDMAQYQAMSM